MDRGPRGHGRNARLQDEGSQHDGNPGGRGARFEQEENNLRGNGTPNQFAMDFFAALVAANILNQPRVDAESRAREITKDFRRMNPPSFDGSTARRYAKRVARATGNVEAPDIENLTWAEFEKIFKIQYFPESYCEQLREKFENFEQGTMTISEYAMQYQVLSRFAPELVNTEEKKCRRFKKGLHSSVRRLVMSSRLRVFTEIVELARTLELPRDNVRNAWGNKGRQSMGSVGMASGSLGDTRRDHRSLATSVAKRVILGLIVHKLHHSLDLLHHRILRHRVLALGMVALATWLGFAHIEGVHVASPVQFSNQGRVRVLVSINRGGFCGHTAAPPPPVTATQTPEAFIVRDRGRVMADGLPAKAYLSLTCAYSFEML
ncbi:hypothetical protein Acr_00g0031930 [Actinidia rufa]|uniref:Retrotransposon gag domain-containing protein n=1 Tax=Actinidia rufa TaxID=165716 RepID=A0A7J0DH48_9ERIC|nr:hypothetical protein Acr_00g0031930 [Actinidia rufa]